MRILHLSSEQTWRGGEQQMAYLFEELWKKGIEQFVATRAGSAFEQYCIKNKIAHITCSFSGGFNIASALKIKKFCRENKIDIIHAHSSGGHTIAVWSQVLGNKIPLILSRRVDFTPNKNPFSKFKYNYQGIKKIICVSDAVKQILSTSLKRPEKCITIYDGIDLNRFATAKNSNILHREFNLASDVKIIANVAALAPHKDYFTFLNTVKQLQGKLPAKFFIIGEGDLREKISQRIRDIDLGNEVVMTGFRNDLEAIFPEIDVLLFTSETEGLGTTILDAFACGVPVVATAVGGIPEIVNNNENGLLAPIKDADELAKNVLRIMDDNNLRWKLTQQAKEDVKKFSKEDMAAKTLEVYREVIKG
jgi:L-malate glycosyltransferase